MITKFVFLSWRLKSLVMLVPIYFGTKNINKFNGNEFLFVFKNTEAIWNYLTKNLDIFNQCMENVSILVNILMLYLNHNY